MSFLTNVVKMSFPNTNLSLSNVIIKQLKSIINTVDYIIITQNYVLQ